MGETDLWKGSSGKAREIVRPGLQTDECDQRLGPGSLASGGVTQARAERAVLGMEKEEAHGNSRPGPRSGRNDGAQPSRQRPHSWLPAEGSPREAWSTVSSARAKRLTEASLWSSQGGTQPTSLTVA